MTERPITDNIAKLLERVRLSAEKSQRNPRDIRVLAVSKTRPASDIRAAYECGLRDFAESYLQEALPKLIELADLDICWHFIGPIQSNKTRQIAEHFEWVHSVDRARIAQRLNDQRPAQMPPLQICLQVNISGEDSKSGATEQALPELLHAVAALPRLTLRGLMAIPAADLSPDLQRQAFAGLRASLEQLRALAPELAPNLDTLSMGMSGDLESAIAEGATMVRIGTALFGTRNR